MLWEEASQNKRTIKTWTVQVLFLYLRTILSKSMLTINKLGSLNRVNIWICCNIHIAGQHQQCSAVSRVGWCWFIGIFWCIFLLRTVGVFLLSMEHCWNGTICDVTSHPFIATVFQMNTATVMHRVTEHVRTSLREMEWDFVIHQNLQKLSN